ncbi:Enoyl-CoA delta isomerase 2, mitochondrial [Choanephora cucurbitarum]|uniref:Enoyl-CoA delta isomerase 2, mitochondrial n=1 Tax=Choanephora cucurbitarum TaxID=101091 RepID=A0A1C7NGM7_9FUNG|nr:Enoyl-CoA delta isomerase 2, mitochondrial [Choanephora cucurbitarum]
MVISIPLLESFQITLNSSGVTEIAFNRPKKFNALSPQVYRDWLAVLRWAAQSDAVKVVVMTGRGPYYTSGQELQEPDYSPAGQEFNRNRRLVTKALVDTFIQFPKLLIAGVNGNAIGFGVTSLALCDVVYSVPDATFSTPFMKLGYCAEGCSSVLFPRIMGSSKANEMLLMGRTFTAQELVDCGMVSRILPAEEFHGRVLALAEEAAKFSGEAIAISKRLIRDVDRQLLLNTNEIEMIRLDERSRSKDSQDAIMRFMEDQKRKKAAKLARQAQSQSKL